MCGIIACLPVYSNGSTRLDPGLLPGWPTLPGSPEELLSGPGCNGVLDDFVSAAEHTAAALAAPGARIALFGDSSLRDRFALGADQLGDWAGRLDALLDSPDVRGLDADQIEDLQCKLTALRDCLYSARHDCIELARSASLLVPQADRTGGFGPADSAGSAAAALSYLAIEVALEAIDRLEVRGRDSAGLSVWITLSPQDQAALAGKLAGRQDPLLRSGAVQLTPGGACFTYKRAAIVGRLGDNVAALRRAIAADRDLHRLLVRPSARITVLGHTRWASVGRISEANAHPVDSQGAGPGTPYVIAALNGDIDNYAELDRPDEGSEITTDAKVIPALLIPQLVAGTPIGQALRKGLASFAGSMAIAALSDADPDQLTLAVKGSGQGLYAGFGAGMYVVASEVYGLVATCRSYLRIDGGAWPGADRAGTVLTLARTGMARPDGLAEHGQYSALVGQARLDGDGTLRPITGADLRRAEVTTRDLALGKAHHYLHKEIHEAPAAFRKTLRGRIRSETGNRQVNLPDSALPAEVRARLRSGEIREVVLIGQGTAAIACQGVATLLRGLTGTRIAVSAMPATEFSAWELRPDMHQVCVVAISQSGTTTDTNRSVDLAAERGASIISIVNRRDSDLTMKSHGVLYTSDGRDIEMSVASTKAFYAQVAAGCLFGLELAREVGRLSGERETELLDALVRMPSQLAAVQAQEQRIADTARELCARYPYWTVLGSGPNRAAAEEVRIKLSELCYKTISTDAVENKKHIDLSAEAFVVVCAAGAPPQQLSDLVKEVEILSAHGNMPVVFCDDACAPLWPSSIVTIGLPNAHPDLAWILAAAAGHLLAYHAAVHTDNMAASLRLALARLEEAVDTGSLGSVPALPREVAAPIAEFLEDVWAGNLRGVLTSQRALDLARLITAPTLPGWTTELYPRRHADLAAIARAALTGAIDELARPVDSVKHQAKSVTVGTSRDDSDLMDNQIIRAVLAAGAQAHHLRLPVLRAIRRYAALCEDVLGVTRYQICNRAASIVVVAKTGAVVAIPSRADRPTELIGSKRRVAELGEARIVRGRIDGRIVVIIPELDGATTASMAVVHIRLRARNTAEDLAAALNATGDRLEEIVATITETDPFELSVLGQLPTEDVLLAPVEALAEQIRALRA